MPENLLRFTSHYIVPVKTYALVLIALLVLLALSIAAAQIEHGAINLLVGLSIATLKMSLIMLFFMHLRYNPLVVRVAAAAGFLWLTILITITMADYLTRG